MKGQQVATSGSVSQWIQQAKSGSEQALAKLHTRYWPRLVELATTKMRGVALQDRDAEDVAQISFFSVYQAIKAQQTPNLDNRHQFLAFLTHVIACKAINEMKQAFAMKRGGGAVVQLSELETLSIKHDVSTPAETAILNDCYAKFVNSLPEHLVKIAEYHLAGFTNREIADKMSCVERTIERKLSLIRQHWKALAEQTLEIPESL